MARGQTLFVWVLLFALVYLYCILQLNAIAEQLGSESVALEIGKRIQTRPVDCSPSVSPLPPSRSPHVNVAEVLPTPDSTVIQEKTARESNFELSSAVQVFGSDVSYTDHKNIEWLFPKPNGVPEDQLWRYKSTNLYWSKNDTLYRKFDHYKNTLEFPPKSVKDEIDRVCSVLQEKGRDYLCKMFRQTYPNTLETTTSILEDNTVYVITGDIGLMWMRDSSAQVHQYVKLLKHDPYIQILIEGLGNDGIRFISLTGVQ